MQIKLLNFGLTKNLIPTRAYSNDAGLDIYLPCDIEILPGQTIKIPLAFGLEIPAGHMGLILPRSSLATKGVFTQLPPIDSGYRGEIHAVVYNSTKEFIKFKYGERIGQLVILPIVIPTLVNFTKERADNGFGSSGK